MTVDTTRAARYQAGVAVHDWAYIRAQMEAHPGEWLTPLPGPISSSSIAWLRTEGPIALRDIREEVEYRMKEGFVPEGLSSRHGTLYVRWTPGQKAQKYKSGVMSDAQIVEAREAYAEGGVTQVALARKYGITINAMNKILRGHSRRDAGGPIHSKEK